MPPPPPPPPISPQDSPHEPSCHHLPFPLPQPHHHHYHHFMSLPISLLYYSYISPLYHNIPPSSKATISFQLLKHHLSSKDFQQADQETRHLFLILAGEAAQKRGYIFFSEVQFIPESHLKAIDELWREHSNNRYGYSVQKKIWEDKERDFSRLFIKIGWMKKLDTPVKQFNYKSFPDEFCWEMNDDDDDDDDGTPDGHLPLTNALVEIHREK